MAIVPIELEGDATWCRERRLGHYGAAPDKRASKTEGDRPYAFRWYRELQASRGSAYSTESGTIVHVENLALARFMAGLTRTAEKLYTNEIAITADERIDYHRRALGVASFPGDTRHDLRLRCAAKEKAATGNDRTNVDSAIADLLGPIFVRSWRQEGADLATPPTQTFWPGINPGPASYSLGGGAWLSERAHLVVEVRFPEGMLLSYFLEQVNTHLFRLLTFMLPAHMTFNWAIGVETGFVLDVSQLDFGAVT